jgi:hypothetical protein
VHLDCELCAVIIQLKCTDFSPKLAFNNKYAYGTCKMFDLQCEKRAA